MSTNLFLIASRNKWMLETARGTLSVEMLWDLPLQSARSGVITLDDVARGLSKQIKEFGEESFVTPTTRQNDTET
jgi:hypothetical protein